jgi:hypothetical protein
MYSRSWRPLRRHGPTLRGGDRPSRSMRPRGARQTWSWPAPVPCPRGGTLREVGVGTGTPLPYRTSGRWPADAQCASRGRPRRGDGARAGSSRHSPPRPGAANGSDSAPPCGRMSKARDRSAALCGDPAKTAGRSDVEHGTHRRRSDRPAAAVTALGKTRDRDRRAGRSSISCSWLRLYRQWGSLVW